MSKIYNEGSKSNKSFARKIKRAYEIAPPRIQQCLEAEIQYVLKNIEPSDFVLELGCGYGRVLSRLAVKADKVIGIDTSKSILGCAEKYLIDRSNIELLHMTARALKFDKETFDVVVAIQNPISAFKIDPPLLINECLKVAKNGGKVIISSYSEKIWEERLRWFIQQSDEGLLKKIDFTKTVKGTIVCKDGYTTKTFSKENFSYLIKKMNLKAIIEEIDQSIVFCVINVTHY